MTKNNYGTISEHTRSNKWYSCSPVKYMIGQPCGKYGRLTLDLDSLMKSVGPSMYIYELRPTKDPVRDMLESEALRRKELPFWTDATMFIVAIKFTPHVTHRRR